MNRCAIETMKKIPDIIFAIGASDEYSFIQQKSTKLYNRRNSKILSYIVSLFTSNFIIYWNEYFNAYTIPYCHQFYDTTDSSCVHPTKVCNLNRSNDTLSCSAAITTNNNCNNSNINTNITNSNTNGIMDTDNNNNTVETNNLLETPVFDGRIILYPNDKTIRDYISWRQVDFHINALYNTCYWKLVDTTTQSKQEIEKKLSSMNSSEKHELLFSQYQINYAKLPSVYRKGTIIFRTQNDSVPHCHGCCDSKDVSNGLYISHCDIIKPTFWEIHPYIIPYTSPSALLRSQRKMEKSRHRKECQD